MSAHFKRCSCRICRAAMRAPGASAYVRFVLRAARRANKQALRRGEETVVVARLPL